MKRTSRPNNDPPRASLALSREAEIDPEPEPTKRKLKHLAMQSDRLNISSSERHLHTQNIQILERLLEEAEHTHTSQQQQTNDSLSHPSVDPSTTAAAAVGPTRNAPLHFNQGGSSKAMASRNLRTAGIAEARTGHEETASHSSAGLLPLSFGQSTSVDFLASQSDSTVDPVSTSCSSLSDDRKVEARSSSATSADSTPLHQRPSHTSDLDENIGQPRLQQAPPIPQQDQGLFGMAASRPNFEAPSSMLDPYRIFDDSVRAAAISGHLAPAPFSLAEAAASASQSGGNTANEPQPGPSCPDDLLNMLIHENSMQQRPAMKRHQLPSEEAKSTESGPEVHQQHFGPSPQEPRQHIDAESTLLDSASKKSPPTTRRPYRHESFPAKLYRLLTETEAQGQQHLVSFVMNGHAFQVFQPDSFAEQILPHYFRHSKYSSFLRLLGMYGFSRVPTGPHRGAYQHGQFQKGRPDLVEMIVRDEKYNRKKQKA
mmetsp:Transcript_17405/g.47524  ORF Transcript_17405/g.47524 Transcript_17405/m.47524 type:complete len:485 (-) Transcript_17405:156-1610(-)|eukprot:CAMPEP_0168739114 /NCGR_PEP_ID=MMETSP0724-20121128/11286_1 /TAXON_ID=265536 /ORGANISM="Amphiprora sp., Strain CCMP467" /LENGTH=484 /DNA_ID=CAMNT_0008786487 /DNA_START=290 /DNA_END=1744 /DNA_ORIENTATION=+